MRTFTRSDRISGSDLVHYAAATRAIHIPCSADHEQDWQPYYLVDAQCAESDNHIHTHTRQICTSLCSIRSWSSKRAAGIQHLANTALSLVVQTQATAV